MAIAVQQIFIGGMLQDLRVSLRLVFLHKTVRVNVMNDRNLHGLYKTRRKVEEADGNSFSFFVGKPSHVSASFFLFANDLQKFR